MADTTHPAWHDAEHTIWWHIYPLGFTGAPIRPSDDAERAMTPRLDRIAGWLDYLRELGCDGLLLNPVFDSTSHGYDTINHFRIDPRLGDDAAFDRLVEACHDRGIRLMLDGVFNHVGATHPWFRDAVAGRAHGDLFRVTRDAYGNVCYPMFEGNRDLPELDHGSATAVRYVASVMRHWSSRGVDAWRLDAAYAVPPDFWRRVLDEVRDDFPDLWVMGEMIHGDYEEFVARSGVDSVTQYELWKAIWSSLRDGNFYELDWSLKRHNAFLSSFMPQTFVGNHDVTRLVDLCGDESRAKLAMTVLFTVGGVPSVYYGDERAWHGIKYDRFGGDDDIRPRYPDSPAMPYDDGEGMFRTVRDLIALRRRHPWLIDATTVPTLVDNRRYEYDAVSRDGSGRIHVALGLDPVPAATVSDGDVRGQMG